MKYKFGGVIIMISFALLVIGFCGCASSEGQKPVAEKERESRYSNYVDNIDKEWSEHL